ncbi:MAG: alpha/beta hydrolase [Burkholderiales bacterium]|nr:MAG: alpha/beta hydrolase [Betaproteobacteria bacterium]TAG82888.1 MAG: alpha/beta hydrolase [Burkholderiales bacterium]
MTEIKTSRIETLTLRGHTLSLRHWGPNDAPLVVMLHGWMDVGASFQFLVDALQRDWHVVAPDQRGYGGTEWTRESAGGYWFAEYLADLEAVIDHVSPESPVHLVGHSLGGNVSSIYAGIRPHRVKKLVSLDGFGIPNSSASKAPNAYRKWLDAIKSPPTLSTYASADAVADRLQKNNPRLTRDRALWLANHWAEARPDGRWHLRADPAHKLPFPTVYRLEEVIAIWNEVTAPTLWVGASESEAKIWNGYTDDTVVPSSREGHALGTFASRLAAFRSIDFTVVKGAGHMLHHDMPDVVAALVEAHLVR